MTETVRRNLIKFFLVVLLIAGNGFAFFLAIRNSYSILWLLFFICIGYTANIVPRILMGTREERLLRYFEKKPNVRLNLVKDIVSKGELIKEQLEPLEVVAVYSLLLAKYDISKTIDLMNTISYSGWDKYFNEDFFSHVMKTSQEFRTIGLYLDHKELLQFGEATAHQHNQIDWANSFRQRIEQILQKQRDGIAVIRYHRR